MALRMLPENVTPAYRASNDVLRTSFTALLISFTPNGEIQRGRTCDDSREPTNNQGNVAHFKSANVSFVLTHTVRTFANTFFSKLAPAAMLANRHASLETNPGTLEIATGPPPLTDTYMIRIQVLI
jgi:hypothetical protein